MHNLMWLVHTRLCTLDSEFDSYSTILIANVGVVFLLHYIALDMCTLRVLWCLTSADVIVVHSSKDFGSPICRKEL